MTLKNLCDIFISENTSDLKNTTIAIYITTFALYESFIDLDVNDIDSRLLNKWRNELQANDYSANYINNAINSLSTIFKFGIRQCHLTNKAFIRAFFYKFIYSSLRDFYLMPNINIMIVFM
ncbi:phage integrase SAM-like domain-containing protein [Mycoplasma sp. P36-A1]|uniref:phage integrase SAM-like domain-containing protein n=1 Tax=Mycoplasma sp. P36-A1 TaxID=3252900 RepID=UPI003C2CD584